MIIVKVTFQIPKEMDLKTLKGKFQETAPLYQDTKGLIRKNYICDLDKSIGGGIYCFESREDADSWFDEERIRWLTDPASGCLWPVLVLTLQAHQTHHFSIHRPFPGYQYRVSDNKFRRRYAAHRHAE